MICQCFSFPAGRVLQFTKIAILLQVMILLQSPLNEASANIPFRVSVKFLVDEFGNRPATGALNTDAEVYEQEDYGNQVLRSMFSELRMQVVEIIDLPASLSEYLSLPVDNFSITSIGVMAQQDPATWAWRNDAINMYIVTGQPGDAYSAYSSFPPANHIVLMGQNVSIIVMLHELGHSLNLEHTHTSDGCSDTLTDNADWTKDEVASHNYGVAYDLLTTAQKNSVDYTFHNVMSYHWDRKYLTECQKDRVSRTAYDDRSWLLARTPVYISYTRSSSSCKYNPSFTCVGNFLFPFQTIQDALDYGLSAGSALVFDADSYAFPAAGINLDADIYTRQGVTTLDDVRLYRLPAHLERSENPAVSDAVRQAQREATLSRKVLKDAEKTAEAYMVVDPGAIRDYAGKKSKEHKDNVIRFFRSAEQYATGDEKLAIQMELAQRHKDEGNYQLCFSYYKRVAGNTGQKYLKEMALQYANQCKAEMSAKKEAADMEVSPE